MNNNDLRKLESSMARRKLIEKITGRTLPSIGNTVLVEENFAGHCENPIGAVQIPLGVAGPLRVESGEWKVESGYIPLATTEGALIASVNRGCKAVTESGGVSVEVKSVGITRGPVFRVENLSEGRKFQIWIKEHTKEIQEAAKSTSSHLSLIHIKSRLVGRNVFVRFSYDTQDAMGMNMATIATQEIVRFIETKTPARSVAVAGNFDVDKKPSFLNFLSGRGKVVWAESFIKKEIVESILKTTPEKIVDVVYRKSLLGSAVSGSLGFNGHYANIIAAIFTATGQDIAHVVEGSLGITTAEIEKTGDLYFSIYLPSVIVGTVGGGTNLPSQQEALEIMGVNGGDGGKNAMKFAGIIGGAVLAGELSLTASLAEGSLARAHDSFRKNNKSPK